MPLTGIEPVRYRYRGILSPLRLPVPPQRHNICIVAQARKNVNLPICIFAAKSDLHKKFIVCRLCFSTRFGILIWYVWIGAPSWAFVIRRIHLEKLTYTHNDAAAKVLAAFYETPPLAYVRSYGCQQNVNDGEKIKGVLQDVGYGLCDNVEHADLILFNTCAVREHAEQRVFGNVGALKKLKEQNPRLMIGVCGCMAQQEHIVEKLRQSYPYVDLVFGVDGIDRLPTMLAERIRKGKRYLEKPTERNAVVEELPIRRDSGFRAWLPIMYGCDNFCTYCIVPYVRGRERSREPAAILAEFKQLIAQGYKEITLLGQNVNSYGKGLENPIDFADLLNLLCEVPGDYQIRFMTSHPKDASRKLIDTIAAQEHLCKHIHLPV